MRSLHCFSILYTPYKGPLLFISVIDRSSFSLQMPCHFSGIFYVSQFKDNKLLCSFKDENGDVHQINIIYYFPTTVDRPFPQAYEAIQPGHVYFIAGPISFHSKDLMVHSLKLSLILTLLKLNATLIYRQNLYTEIDISHTIFGSLTQALPSMFLTIIGTARVTQPVTVSRVLKDHFPNWKYFTGEFEQFIAGSKRV